MLTKELFSEILQKFIEHEEFVDSLQKLNIDIIDSAGFETSGYLFDKLIEAYFNKDGCDWITWYMFEKRNNPDIKAIDENGIEICKNIDELWDIVKEYLK